MHRDRVGHIKDPIALRATPTGVFVVLRVLKPFIETAPGPDVFANAAAGHAEEMFPSRRLAAWAEATLVIVDVNCPAIRPWDLPTEYRARLWIKQRPHQRPQ